MPDYNFTQYRRKQIAELRPYFEGEDVSHVSISPEDAKAGSPKCGDMIARNPKNHADQWLVARAYFLDNFEALTAAEPAEPAPAARSGAVNEPVSSHWPEAHEVADIVAEGNGFWRSCSGCHELNEGHPTGPWSVTLGCNLGCGCDECGGIGAVWDTTDYADMGEALAALEPAEPATGAEPVAWLYDWVDDDGETQTEASTNRISSVNFKPTSSIRPLYTRPHESRLREADVDEILLPLEDIHSDRGQCEWHDVAKAIDETRRRLRAALAQGADDE